MKIVIQRVKSAKVEVENEIVGKINEGLLLLVCFVDGDTEVQVDKAVNKISKLRIFNDEAEKMNLDISQISGQILAVSQFTLAWDGERGHRPSFDRAMQPQRAQILFKVFVDKLREIVPVETGRFGVHMNVTLENNGPATFILEF